MDFPQGGLVGEGGREEKIYLAVSVDALQHDRTSCVQVCAIQRNRSNKWSTKAKLGCLAHSVWVVFYFRGGKWKVAEACFSRRGLQRERWKRCSCSCGVVSCARGTKKEGCH